MKPIIFRLLAAGAAVAVSAFASASDADAAFGAPSDYEAAVHQCLLEHNQFWHVEEIEVVDSAGTLTTTYVCVPLRIPLYE